MTRDHGRGHRLLETHSADDAVSAPMLTGAARAVSDRERFEDHRETPLEDLRVSRQGVGHVGVDRVGAVVVGAGAGAAADGLVVLVAGVVAEGEIVHGPLPRRHDAERADHGVGHRLAGLDVARDDGGRILGRQHAVFRDDDLERLEAARVERNLVVDHEPEYVKHGGHADRRGGVEVGVQLRRGAGEVDDRLARLAVDLDVDADLRARVHLVLV